MHTRSRWPRSTGLRRRGVAEAPAPSSVCRLCGGALRPAFTTTDRNRALSDVPFDYLRCARCGTYSLASVPEDLGLYYPPEYYGPADRAALEQVAASPAEQAKLDLIRPHVAGGRLVEIGPGGGQFSLAASHAGFAVSAIEMDAASCERLERVVGVSAICSDHPETVLDELGASDVIALWHVLEHLRDPAIVLERIAANLRTGGVLALAVPNPQSLQFRLLRGRWAHVDAPRHLFLVPLRALVGFMASHGLALAAATTCDPAGRHWNRFGWEYALRRPPANRQAGLPRRVGAGVVTRLLWPLEGHGMVGSTYTAVFVKRG